MIAVGCNLSSDQAFLELNSLNSLRPEAKVGCVFYELRVFFSLGVMLGYIFRVDVDVDIDVDVDSSKLVSARWSQW